MRGTGHASGLVYRHRYVRLVVRNRISCVQANPDPDLDTIRPRLAGKARLHCQRRSYGFRRTREHREDPVTHLVADNARMKLDDLLENPVVEVEQDRVSSPETLVEPRRTLDIGEDEGQPSRRQHPHVHSLPGVASSTSPAAVPKIRALAHQPATTPAPSAGASSFGPAGRQGRAAFR